MIWIVFTVLAIILSIPNLNIPYNLITGFTLGLFVGAEWVAYLAEEVGDTLSEFVWDWVPHPTIRWGLGVWIGSLVIIRVNPYLGIGVVLWLPLHWAHRNFEKRLLR